MPYRLAIPVFVVLLAWASRTNGAVVEEVTIDRMSRTADLVVLGKVESLSCRYDGGSIRRRIVTDVTVRVSRGLRGDPGPSGEVIVTVPGGVVDGKGQLVPGAPRMTPGEEVFLFLRTGEAGASGRVRATVYGLSQGLFVVERDADGNARARQRLQGVTLVPGGDREGREMDLDALVRAVQGARP